MSPPTLLRTQEAQEALDRIEDPGTRVFANMLYALVVQRAFGERRIETEMNIDSYFLIRVFEEYFSTATRSIRQHWRRAASPREGSASLTPGDRRAMDRGYPIR